jgi:hypothetical protein
MAIHITRKFRTCFWIRCGNLRYDIGTFSLLFSMPNPQILVFTDQTFLQFPCPKRYEWSSSTFCSSPTRVVQAVVLPVSVACNSSLFPHARPYGLPSSATRPGIPNLCAMKFQKCAAKFRNRTVLLAVKLNMRRNKIMLFFVARK